MYSKVIFFIFFLCLCLNGLSSQTRTKDRLFIGDKVPDVQLESMVNYPGGKGQLSDFAGKTIILDFWNRNCSSCIAAFPELQNLQEKYKDSIQILLVTPNTRSELERLFRDSPILRSNKLPIVIADTTLSKRFFPHQMVPYHVWLDNNRIVKATTNGFAATDVNISNLINGRDLKVPIIEDYMELDSKTSLLTEGRGRHLSKILFYANNMYSNKDYSNVKLENRDGNMNNKDDLSCYSVLMKYIKIGMNGFSMLNDSISGKQIGLRFMNIPILVLCRYAYGSSFREKVIVEGDEERYFPPENASTAERVEWTKKNSFCYEARVPDYDEEKFKSLMKKDLERFFGIKGDRESKEMECLILFRSTAKDIIKSKGGASVIENTKSSKGFIFNNIQLAGLLTYLEGANSNRNDPILINETGFDSEKRIDAVIKSDLRDISSLNNELEKYGLGLRLERRTVDVLVIKE